MGTKSKVLGSVDAGLYAVCHDGSRRCAARWLSPSHRIFVPRYGIIYHYTTAQRNSIPFATLDALYQCRGKVMINEGDESVLYYGNDDGKKRVSSRDTPAHEVNERSIHLTLDDAPDVNTYLIQPVASISLTTHTVS